MLKESTRSVDHADRSETVRAGEYWMHTLKKGDTLRITDLKGNQAVDTLFFNANNPYERYSAFDTVREQANLYLTTGTALLSDEGNPMLTIVADTVDVTIHWAARAQAKATRYGTRLTKRVCTPAAIAGYSRSINTMSGD